MLKIKIKKKKILSILNIFNLLSNKNNDFFLINLKKIIYNE
ncbi:hypothetical protein [Candidatus Nasuia deltocephalinicola]|nr:hypothetical protein [Candidatus Nasuia deltocephalinicola]